MKKQVQLATRLTQLGRNVKDQYGFVNGPIYRGSTVVFASVEDLEHSRAAFAYGTMGTPTIKNLEDAWTELAGAAGTVMSPSGQGAISLALMSTLKAGDHLLMPDTVYRPTRKFCDLTLKKFGVTTEYYDPLVGEGIIELMRPETSTLFLESPGSQTFEIQDVPLMTRLARERGIKTIIDNTWATPVFFQAHRHGCDLSVEAGTKYLSGHSDLLMGLVSANAESWPALRATYDSMAMLPGAEDCFLALRGLRTLHIRLQEAQNRALKIARWLAEQPEVKTLLHPAFESCPGHAFWQRDFSGSSGLFSLVLDPAWDKAAVTRMLDGLSLFGMGYSWGGFESLIIPFDCTDYRTATRWTHAGQTLRLQIGLEDPDDLIADLRQGLDRLHAPA